MTDKILIDRALLQQALDVLFSYDAEEFERGANAVTALRKALEAPKPAAKAVSAVLIASIGHKHFGNPIPKEWYAAAKELIEAISQAALTTRQPADHQTKQPLV